MGVVYRATQLALERTVALKLLNPESAEDERFRERFQRESKVLASIDHPNVITVHEAGEDAGRLFIVMRYVVGTDLRRLLKEGGPLEPARAAGLAAQVGAALDAAHARGLIHRDVKPANVLLEQRDGREHAYLSDFGLTKPADSTAGGLTDSGQWVGTADYVAPEQVMGGPIDARTDVYSLGCVLYTAIAGRVPYQKDSEVAKIFAHVNDPPPSLLEESPELPPQLDEVVRRAMAKDPADRFHSAGDFGSAALAAVEGRAPSREEHTVARGAAAPAASPPTPAATAADERAPARSHRRAVLVAAIGVAAAAIVAVLLLGGSSDEEGDAESTERPALTARPALQTIAVGDGPRGVAVGEGAIWVANGADDTLTPLDPGSGRAGRPIEIGDDPEGVAVAGGMVLVTVAGGREIVRVDPETRRVREPPLRPGQVVGGNIASGGDELWATLETGEVAQIDPASGEVVAPVPIPEPYPDGALVVGRDQVWVVASGGNRSFLFRVNRDSGEVSEGLDLGRGSYAAGLAFGEGAIWAADAGRSRVLRIDPETARVVREIPIPEGISSDDIAVGGGAVWLATTGDQLLLRIDPRSNRVFGDPIRVPTTDRSELAVGLGSAWLTAPGEDAAVRVIYSR